MFLFLPIVSTFYFFCCTPNLLHPRGRLLHLQVWQSDKYSELAANARKNFIQERARRGDIVDRKGSLLATTKSVVVVGWILMHLTRMIRANFTSLHNCSSWIIKLFTSL